MQKLAKGFLRVLLAAIALAVLGVVAINLYVQSTRTRTRIEQEISEAVRLPVRMTGITLTPWHGLKINGVTVGQPEGTSGNFVEASSFTAFFKWAPLLQHRLIVEQININEPKVSWVQNGGGKWQLPSEAKTEQTKPVTPNPAPKPEKEPKEKIAEPKKNKPLEIVVNQLHINHGSFAFLDEHAKPIATFSDVQISCPSVRSEVTQGDARSAKVSIQNKLFFDDVQIPFTFATGDLSLRGLQAKLGGGDVGGSFELQTNVKRSPFTVDVKFDHVDLNRLLTDAGNPPNRAAGMLAGWLDLYGQSGWPESYGGRGQIRLAGGLIQDQLCQLVGQALQIDELYPLNLRQAQADFRIENGFVWLDRVLLESANLQLQAHGTIRLDGKLKINARLILSPQLSRRIPSFIASNFQPGDEPDQRAINFPITGTVSKPHVDLLERIQGQKILKEAVSLYQNIFAKPKKEKKKETKPTPGIPSTGTTPNPSTAPVESSGTEE